MTKPLSASERDVRTTLAREIFLTFIEKEMFMSPEIRAQQAFKAADAFLTEARKQVK